MNGGQDRHGFDDLPASVTHSNGGRLVKAINDFKNRNGALQMLSVLSGWDSELQEERDISKRYISALFEVGPVKSDELMHLLESGDIAGLGEALKTSYWRDNDWVQKEYAKLASIEQACAALKTANDAFRELVTWDLATEYVSGMASVSAGPERMELPPLGERMPSWPKDLRGDKVIGEKTLAEALAGTRQTLRSAAEAVNVMPDGVLNMFLQRPNFRGKTPEEFRDGVAALASAPQVMAIETYVQRHMQGLTRV